MSAIRSLRPQLSVEHAAHLASTLYGLTGEMRELPSERDQNFLLRTSTGEFTLKIANQDETRSILEFQNQAIEKAGLGIAVLPAIDGQRIATARSVEGIIHLIHLLNFIPGIPFAEFKPHSSRLLENLGRMLGRMDGRLAAVDHPARRRELYWDIRNTPDIVERFKHHIEDPARRRTVERIAAEWRDRAVPVLSSLRTGVIHNDANDYNVVVQDEDSVGIVDFGDSLESVTVAEPAIACAYAMLGKPDPIDAAVHVVRGYHDEFPLLEIEADLLYVFIRARLAMSVTISAHQKQLEPENNYLTVSEAPVWALLGKLDEVSPRFALYRFRDACRLPACPKTASVIAFLSGTKSEIGRVVEADLTGDDATVLDLSVGSLETGTFDEWSDVDCATRMLYRTLEDRAAIVGVGRYAEARTFYAGPLFRTDSNDAPVSRTIHLGIDLFMKPGSPVFAPLDGVVHSLRNNAAPLDYGPTVILRHALPDGLQFFTLYGHLSMQSLQSLTEGALVSRGDTIGAIGTSPTNGGWPPHVHFQVVIDMLDRTGEFPGVAAADQQSVWCSLSPDPNWILKIPAEKMPAPPSSIEETLAQRRRSIGRNLSISYKTPLKIVRGLGTYLFDESGRPYLDCVNNVAHVGHCHPAVVHAGQRQMATLNTNTRYLHDNIVEYAQKLTAKLPQPLSVCYFVNSGSEANDLAVRLARAHTRASDMVVMDSAYHGNLTSLIDLSPYKFDGPGGSGRAGHVHTVSVADAYRGRLRYGDKDPEKRYADELQVLLSDLARQGRPLCAYIIESMPSCAGQIVFPRGYLVQAFEHVRRAGGLCIADEVQTGFGRMGSHFWGFETQGVAPDIVTMGKSIGNGHPIGAVVTTAEIAASFDNGMEYFNTFGGNPVSCAIGKAVLDVIENEGLQERALRTGTRLKGQLAELRSRFPLIGDIRGQGLFLGIELVLDTRTHDPAPRQTAYVVERLRTRGILLSTDGPFHNVIKFKPPMAFADGDCDFLVSSLESVLRETGASTRGSGNKIV